MWVYTIVFLFLFLFLLPKCWRNRRSYRSRVKIEMTEAKPVELITHEWMNQWQNIFTSTHPPAPLPFFFCFALFSVFFFFFFYLTTHLVCLPNSNTPCFHPLIAHKEVHLGFSVGLSRHALMVACAVTRRHGWARAHIHTRMRAPKHTHGFFKTCVLKGIHRPGRGTYPVYAHNTSHKKKKIQMRSHHVHTCTLTALYISQ